MRPLAIIGILFVVIGAYVLFQGGGSVKTRDDLVKIGDVKISTTERHAIPGWAGGAAIALGAILVVAGVSKRG